MKALGTGLTTLVRDDYILGHSGAIMWASDPWANPTYCWVVICKNTKSHHSTNLMIGHKIPLAETDVFEPMPVSGPFLV